MKNYKPNKVAKSFAKNFPPIPGESDKIDNVVFTFMVICLIGGLVIAIYILYLCMTGKLFL